MIKLVLRLVFICAALWVFGLWLYTAWVTKIPIYEGNAEGIVVLTGGERRVETGLRLLEESKGGRLLISGVHPDVKIAEILAINHRDASLADRIDLGFAAQDTLGNADETTKWVEKNHLESLIVVTAHYHMPRALIHLGEQLPNVAFYAYPIVPEIFQDKQWFRNPAARRLIVNDYNKFLLTYPQILLLRYTR